MSVYQDLRDLADYKAQHHRGGGVSCSSTLQVVVWIVLHLG